MFVIKKRIRKIFLLRETIEKCVTLDIYYLLDLANNKEENN